MTYYRIAPSALPAWFTTYVNVAVANSAVLGLTPPQVTALQAQLTSLNAAFTASQTAHDAAKSATVVKDTEVSKTMALIAGYANAWQANPAVPDQLIAALGLIVRDTSPSPRPVFTPGAVSVIPNTTGTNLVRWQRNGNQQGIKFDIEVSYDAQGSWEAVTTVTAAQYKHTGQTPGQLAFYRVRARNRGQVSDWSVPGSTFGGGGQMLKAA